MTVARLISFLLDRFIITISFKLVILTGVNDEGAEFLISRKICTVLHSTPAIPSHPQPLACDLRVPDKAIP